MQASQALRVRRASACAAAFVLPVYYAISGGSYDLLVRHEEALAIWLLLAFSLAFGLLPRSRLGMFAQASLYAVAALAVLNLISVTWTESDGRTIDELARVAHYGGLVLLALLSLNRYTWRAAAGGLVAAGLAICVLADASWLAPAAIPDQVGTLQAVNRLSYPLDYWNATGAWGAMSLAGALAFSAHSRQPVVRAAALALVPAAGLAVYLSYSRAGVVGACIGLVFVLAFSRNRWTALGHAIVAAAGIAIVILVARGQPEIAHGTGASGAGVVAATLLAAGLACTAVTLATATAGLDRIRMPRQSARVAVACGVVAALLVAATAVRGPINDAWEEFQDNTATTTVSDDPATRLTSLGGARRDLWDSALAAYSEEPLTGLGPGTFEFWWSRNPRTVDFTRDAHSLYLEQLAELGLPGLLLLLAFLGALLAAGVQARIRAVRTVDAGAGAAMLSMFGVFLVQAGVDWMWELTAVTVLGLGAAAIAAAAASGRRGRLSPFVRAGLVAACVIAAVAQIPGLVSTARTRESESVQARGELARASELADQAIDAEPWASEPYVQRASVAEAQGDLDRARDDLLEAIDREPTNWRPTILLAQVELQRGDLPAARSAFADARRLHPYSTLYTTFPLFRSQILGTAPPAP